MKFGVQVPNPPHLEGAITRQLDSGGLWDREMKLSINDKIINKNETGASQSKGFRPFDLTPEQLAEHIAQGHAISFQFKGAHRKSENFLCSDIIAADIDDGMTLEEAMSDPFILNNACLLYTTPSHTPEEHRFRLIFQLPHTVADVEQIKILLRGLIRKFPTADTRVKDGARQFYGSKGCTPHLFGKVLSDENYNLLIKLGQEPIDLSDRQDNGNGKSGSRSVVTLEADSQVRTAKGDWVRLADMKGSKPIYCPFHNDKNPSAHTIVSRSNNAVGVHCSKCQMSFWPKDKQPVPYDFFDFDKLVRREVEDFVPSIVSLGADASDPSQEMVIFDHKNLLLNQAHLEKLPSHQGITLIKSPKGTGKTTYLKSLVSEYRNQGKRVLLVGHRRSLLRALSESLGLQCYLDAKDSAQFAPNRISKHFAVSVDSMATMLKPNIHKFDVVLIDESEQVFSHLIASTLDLASRRKCYLLLQHYIQAAKDVIALDADLNQITLDAIQRFGSKNPFIDRRLILNEYKIENKKIELYSSENQVIGDLFESIRNQDRVFVCCNSKKQVDALVESIQAEFGADFRLFSVTSANSNSPEATAFLTDIKREILKYRVVLVSPAMGTGIDITFPESVSHIDGVYGLFEARINTHFDIDQQLSRVRHPKYIRIWISPETFNFETEIDPIKQEIAESGIIPEVLTGYSVYNGAPEYNWNDPYLTLYATILSAQRASKNQLRKNFINLRTYNGWIVEQIERHAATASIGAEHAKHGEALRRENRIQRILKASVLDSTQVDDINHRKDGGKSVTEAEQDAMDRYFIEHFYYLPVSRELLILDNEGKHQNQIRMFEWVTTVDSVASENISEIHAKVRLLTSLYQSAGVFSDSEFDASVTITNDDLKSFVATCKKQKLKIERLLGTTLRNDYSSKPMQQLNQFLGMCGIKAAVQNTVKKNGQKIYQYKIDDAALGEIQEIVKRRKSKHTPVTTD